MAIAVSVAPSGATAKPPADSPQLTAYRHAVRCFYANGRMRSLLNKRGETDRAAVFEANAERSHRGAVALGRAAGLSDAKMAEDLDAYRSGLDLAHMMTDADFFDKVAATCKAIGLM